MSRIPALDPAEATGTAAGLLAAVQASLGTTRRREASINDVPIDESERRIFGSRAESDGTESRCDENPWRTGRCEACSQVR